jgi:hypothetical protein
MGFQETEMKVTKDKLVGDLERLGRQYIPETLLSSNRTTIDFLHSNGILVVQKGKVYFAHQSILDSFLAEKMTEQYYSEVDMADILGIKEKQNARKKISIADVNAKFT